VVLSGLCGPMEELIFFYEVRRFLQHALDTCFFYEASQFRELLGDSALWGPPGPSPEREEVVGGTISQALPIGLVSHQNTSIVTNSVDVRITLYSAHVAAMRSELCIIRFGGEEEVVPRATQDQRLEGNFFFVRVKLPIARCRYELRFLVSPPEDPGHLQRHPLKYTIATSDGCQTLLSSLEDPLCRKFGYAELSLVAQLHGIVVLAPTVHRILVGQCYFLVYVNKAIALAMAHTCAKAAETAAKAKAETKARGAATAATLPPERPGTTDPKNRSVVNTTQCRQSATTLFTKRLEGMPEEESTSSAADGEMRQQKLKKQQSQAFQSVTMMEELHQKTREKLEPRTQDGEGDIHLDVMMHDGRCMHSLRERCDFPGFYEGLVLFNDADTASIVRLQFRTPHVQAAVYAPRALGEWFICRFEHFPINF